MTVIITPLNKNITIHKDGRIEGDFDDLAGWVRSGSHRDQEAFMRWFLFLKEWERQKNDMYFTDWRGMNEALD